MPDWIAIVLRPFVALVLFVAAVYLARAIVRLVPAGRVRRWLTAPHALIPANERERRDFTAPLVLLGGAFAMETCQTAMDLVFVVTLRERAKPQPFEGYVIGMATSH